MLLPAAARYHAELLAAQLAELAGETSELIEQFTEAIKSLESANLADNQPHDDVLEHARYMHDTVVPAMDAVRAAADQLERVVADDLWPLPKYSEILFVK
jgi:glutamine synthetase